MPRLDSWQAIGVICGAALAALALVGKAWKGVRRMWHLARKTSMWLDEVLGAPGHPSLMDRVAKIEELMAEHLEWHGDPRGRPAARGVATVVPPYANGGQSGPRHRRG